jgi:hypothetical protein
VPAQRKRRRIGSADPGRGARDPGGVSPDALDSHVDELCREYGIKRTQGSHGRGRAEVHGRGERRRFVVRIPPIRGQVGYFIALHEIGHLFGPGRSGTRLEKEAAAWRWALAASAVAPTDATRRRLGTRLRSYVRWAELRQHRRRPPVIPPHASTFWSLLAYLEA